jgi:lysophospholipase L1-like esterase
MKRNVWLTLLALLLTPLATLHAAESRPGNKALPQVLIIGDSISLGYTPYVEGIMKAEATVAHNKGNAGHTGTGLQSLDTWLGTTKWDVIHFNWGLHDLCYRNPESKTQGNRDKVKGKLTTSLEQYEANLDQLVLRLKKTNAVLIWATTTVVPEGEEGRFVGDDEKYNAVAARVMKKHGIMVDDLHAVAKGFGPELFRGPGNVHYQPNGYKKLAEQVAEKIRTALKGR